MAQAGPRVRFAPSPTGYFHVGGARTALYNWLVARRLGGTFILRIEDTDTVRSDPAWTDGILQALKWLDISWDEGPYLQSERLDRYEAAALQLIEAQKAYACDCTREQVEARSTSKTPGYDGYCRDRGLEPGIGRALRFRVPDEGATVVRDLIRGEVVFDNTTIEDFVIRKSNGDPLFVLAVAVDDMAMGITDVIRGEEHLPTTPKAVLLWQALGGGELPRFAHLPLLVNEKRQKLSKRRDRVALEDYRALGYLPEAMVNYLALLGWAPADGSEVLDLERLVAEFRLEEVNRSPAYFDLQRLAHFNGLYIRALDDSEFVERVAPFLEANEVPWPRERFDQHAFDQLAPLVKERVATLGDVPGLVEFLFADPFVPDEAAYDKAIRRDDGAGAILSSFLAATEGGSWEREALREALVAVADEVGRKLGKAQAPIRVATMGRSAGLPLFESLEVLGRERATVRLHLALRAAMGA